ncbi:MULTISPECIES: hypothetical protein [Nocardia]|uniref:hypothetical protein n=1 Tax=Nocardia TaxID=1817 RepID=UPI000D68A89C|nr:MULTISPECIES: hypothetical protein [Nocardia]
MTDTPGLEWLTMGAEVAHAFRHHGTGRIKTAVVDKIGKRDVVVTVGGRVEKFNIGRTCERDGVRWLERSEGTWNGWTELGPLDSPWAAEMFQAQRVENAAYLVQKASDGFASKRDVESARALRSAVDVFLKLAEPEGEAS